MRKNHFCVCCHHLVISQGSVGRALLLISICTHMTVAHLKYECVPFMEKANRCLLLDNLECRGDQGENSQKLLKGTCLSGRG